MVEIIAVFQDGTGVPITGLTPNITIYNTKNNPVTVAQAATPMTEIENGIYIYFFNARDSLKRYYAFVDGGAGVVNNWQRYKYNDVSYRANE